jgi:hypothetical protein
MEIRSSNVLKRHFSEARVTHDPRWATSVKIGHIFEPDNNFDNFPKQLFSCFKYFITYLEEMILL